MPTGFVKSTIHAPSAAAPARLVCDLEHDGDGAQRLREPARAGRLLADAAARERDGLVGEARGLAPDANLDQHEVGSVERAVELAGEHEPALVAASVEHSPRERADDLAPGLVDVVQRELVHVEHLAVAREPRHELRRVRRPGADDGNLHPFTPVSVTPSTNARCARKNRMITGSIISTVAAMTMFHSTWWSERKFESPTESTQWSGFSPR